MSTKLSSMDHSALHLENLDNEQAGTVNDALNFFFSIKGKSITVHICFTFSLHFIYSRLLLRQILSFLSLHRLSRLLGKDALINISLVCLDIGLTN